MTIWLLLSPSGVVSPKGLIANYQQEIGSRFKDDGLAPPGFRRIQATSQRQGSVYETRDIFLMKSEILGFDDLHAKARSFVEGLNDDMVSKRSSWTITVRWPISMLGL